MRAFLASALPEHHGDRMIAAGLAGLTLTMALLGAAALLSQLGVL